MHLSDYLKKRGLSPSSSPDASPHIDVDGEEKYLVSEAFHQGTGGEELSTDETKTFLEGEPVSVSSSFINAAQYLKETQSLIIQFWNNDTWVYEPYTIEEAEEFAAASSKGIWFHDNVRVRGNPFEHHRTAYPYSKKQLF